MPTTATLLLPYPGPTEPADVPTDMAELATRLETVRGLANGYASLDATGKVPAAQLPAAVAAADLAYVEFTATVSVTATVEATPNDVVSAPAVTYDGTPIIIEFYAPRIDSPNVAAATIRLNLWDASSNLGYIVTIASPTTTPIAMPAYAVRRLVPTAGSHTYRVRAFISSGTTTGIAAGPGGAAGGHVPGFIRIRKA